MRSCAYFAMRRGGDVVDDLVRQAKLGRAHLNISVVNLIEVLYILARYFGREKALQCVDIARRIAEPISVDEQIAIDTAILRVRCKLGLADCFAAGLAIRTGATLVTADPEFARFGKQLKLLCLPRHSV